MTTIEAVGGVSRIDASATSKAMPVVKEDGTLVLALVRGDDRLSETKLYEALPGASRPATDDEIRAAFGANGGSLGPIGFQGEIVADEALREGQFVAGANRDGCHLRGVEAGRDYEPRFADLREPREGDRARSAAAPELPDRDRGRSHLNFGSYYSGAARRRPSSTRTARRSRSLGGSYGIGPGRVMAAVVEQHHDGRGSSGPRASPRTTYTWSR